MVPGSWGVTEYRRLAERWPKSLPHGSSRDDVDPHVVDASIWDAVGDGGDEALMFLGRNPRKVRNEDWSRKIFLEVGAAVEFHWFRVQPAFGNVEAGRDELVRDFFRGWEPPRAGPPSKAVEVVSNRRECGGHARDVSGASPLRHEVRARLHAVCKTVEEAVMLRDPVKGRCRENGVQRRHRGKRLRQVRLNEENPILKRSQRLSRDVKHRGRRVEGDHAAAREACRQLGGNLPAAAAGIEHDLVTTEGQTVEDSASHAGHRRRNPVVRGGIPLAWSGSHEADGTAVRVVQLRDRD
jgi:hypothetical protein